MKLKKMLGLSVSVAFVLISTRAISACGDQEGDVATGNNANCWDCSVVGDTTSHCTARYDTQTKTLTVSGQGKMRDYQQAIYNSNKKRYESSAPWFDKIYNNSSRIEFQEGITSVGSNAFYTWPAELLHPITDVVLSATIHNIGDGAFQNNELSNIVFPDSLEEIGSKAFANILAQNIIIPNSVKRIGTYAFTDDENLINVYCPNQINCEYAVGRSVYTDENGIVKSSNIIRYTIDSNNMYNLLGKKYLSLEDMLNGKEYEPKRIYTVSEAEAALGNNNKNTFKLKYR